MKPWMRIGHRGASGHAPENTIAAFRKALDLGADAIELDVHLTRDGHLAVLHDETLERTTDGRGRVAEMAMEEIRRADAGAWFGEAFRGERVPTLEEVFDAIPGSVPVFLEIKAEAAAHAVARAVEQRGAADRVVAMSFAAEALKAVRQRSKAIDLALIVRRRQQKTGQVENAFELFQRARAAGASRLNVQLKLVSKDMVQEIHRLGGWIGVWTANTPEEIAAAADTGLDAITSNYPDRLKAAAAAGA